MKETLTSDVQPPQFNRALLSNIIAFALSLSKGGSWFDKLTTNGFHALGELPLKHPRFSPRLP